MMKGRTAIAITMSKITTKRVEKRIFKNFFIKVNSL
jgi:hypothetical protein